MPMQDAVRFDNLTKSFAKTFMDYMKDPERFSENYRLLLNGLTKTQQEFLISIFARILFVHNAEFYTVNNFSKEELSEQKTIQEKFFSQIRKKDNYFKYKQFNLPINHFEPSVFYYHLGIGKLTNIDRLKGKDIIDAGAFIGDSALVLRGLYPEKIYAFEPVTKVYNTLLETIRLNNLEKLVETVKLGLGSAENEEEIFIDTSSSGSGSSLKATGRANTYKETIQITTIDEFAAKNNLNIGVIKMDTEGSELEILKGAENTIKEHKPALAIAIYHNAEEFFEVKPLIESWNLGYKFYFLKLNPYSLLFETTLICEAE